MSTNESRVNITWRRQSLSYEQLERRQQRAVSGVNRMATRTFRERKNNKQAESFFQQSLNVYINVEKRERARARDKKTPTETNFVGRKTWKFYSGGEKMRNSSIHEVKKKKKRVNRNNYPNICGNKEWLSAGILSISKSPTDLRNYRYLLFSIFFTYSCRVDSFYRTS